MKNYDYKFGKNITGSFDSDAIENEIKKMERKGYELYFIGDVNDFQKYLFRKEKKKIKLKDK